MRDTPAGLEATIRLKDNAEGAETAHEMADGYLPASCSCNRSPRTRAISGLGLGCSGCSSAPSPTRPATTAGCSRPTGVRVPPSDPEELDAKPVRPVKPRALIEAEELLIEAGQGSSWRANVGG